VRERKSDYNKLSSHILYNRRKTLEKHLYRALPRISTFRVDERDGKLPGNQAHEQLMHLTKAEDKELVHWITTVTPCGYAPRYRTVRELAEIIRNRLVRSVNDENVQLVNYDEISRHWVARFMSRYLQLESARRKCIEAARIKDVSVERLTK
jgi:hypothetical protein